MMCVCVYVCVLQDKSVHSLTYTYTHFRKFYITHHTLTPSPLTPPPPHPAIAKNPNPLQVEQIPHLGHSKQRKSLVHVQWHLHDISDPFELASTILLSRNQWWN